MEANQILLVSTTHLTGIISKILVKTKTHIAAVNLPPKDQIPYQT